MARTTIKDIARECGVSLSTVSLVLNNNPRISPATRDKVLQAVERHQYQPNAFARSLASQSSRVLSVVVPDLNHVFADTYFGEIVSGVYDRASELGYKVILDVANQRFVSSGEYLNILKSKRVDAALFIGSSIHDTYLHQIEQERLPFVLVNHYMPGHRLSYIAADYVETARLAAEHLTSLGHRQIGFLSGTNTFTAVDLRNHFITACKDTGVAETDIPWADGWFTEQGGYEAAHWLLNRHPGLTALMGGNDKMAIGALRCLRERNLRVPEDISVIGVDDLPSAAFTIPGLTTVRHDLFSIGSMSVDTAIALFNEEADQVQKTLPVQLVLRESTGPATPRG
ncbi:MAG TPA: LacI family DNA-binding transcriptional regulator [Kiritimatiellia bacterium]|nr:LacI family DNA-binding transcriptional regulator [Kiritimatiellia bacterium]